MLSVVVRRFEHEARGDVEKLVERIEQAVSRQTGFIRLHNSFSPRGDSDELVTVFSFDTRANLEKWENSPIRLRLIEELNGMSSDGTTHTRFDGLALLASPQESVRKIEVVAILIFWILVAGRLLGALADHLLPETFSPLGRDALLVTVNVLLISYVLLPWSSTRLARLKARFSGSARGE